MMQKALSHAIAVVAFGSVLTLSGCASLQSDQDQPPVSLIRTGADPVRSHEDPSPEPVSQAGKTLFEQPGSGQFVAAPTGRVRAEPGADAVNISFEDAPLTDVLKVILGDLLGVPYSLEAGIEGTITLVSTGPVPRDVLLEMLESALEARGIVLMQTPSGIYRVGDAAKLRREAPLEGPQSPSRAGYSVRIVPLEYLAVSEAQKILETLGMTESVLRADPLRNVLMLGAAGPQMDNALRTLKMLDVDVLKGMSLGIYEVANLNAVTLVSRLNEVFTNPEMEELALSARLVPLEEINSVMVVAPSARQLATVREWLVRLDAIGLDDDQAGTQLYVYNIQNGEALQLAGLLGEIFGATSPATEPQRTLGATAPGLEQSELETEAASVVASRRRTPEVRSSTATMGNGTRIVADEVNNSLLVMAAAKDWRNISSALVKLDKTPAQVLVEVSIWEVTLSDELSYGVDWFFNTNTGFEGVTGGGRLSLQNGGLVGRQAPGFSYLFTGSDWRAVINMLASKANVKSLSSPSILVLDNREARIQVGAQQPFRSSETVNTASPEVRTQSVELKDTGVLLSVRPRINAGGLVVMDIQQEVTDVGELDQATGQRSFLKRSVESSVAIQSGDTIILGGLIQDRDTESNGGIPYLSRIPVFGGLFGTTTTDTSRTELLVTISPRAISQYRDFDRVGEEFREKMRGLTEAFRDEFSRNSSP